MGEKKNVGDTFVAHTRSDFGRTRDEVVADFTVTKITKAGIVYASGVVRSNWLSGRPFRGTTHRNCRFKWDERTNKWREYQPSFGSGFYEATS